jgi:hypothetical protein
MKTHIKTHLAIAIPHLPGNPERDASMARLRRALWPEGAEWLPWVHEFAPYYREFTDRVPNHVWSLEMWTWAVETGATHFLTLQDDVIVDGGFWGKLRRMLDALPDEVICLENAHDAAPYLADEGHRWLSTSDMMIGVGNVWPMPVLCAFLAWRATKLLEGAAEAITEDTLQAVFCAATKRRIYSPIPTIIDHDVTIASTYGNDAHGRRRPSVLPRIDSWDDGEWRKRPEHIPHLGRSFYGATIPDLALKALKEYSPGEHRAAMQDSGLPELRRITYAKRARGALPTRKVLICTPTHGNVHPAYSRTIVGLWRDELVDVVSPWELYDAWQWDQDVVHVRSRFVHAFLETDATDLLFLDSDIEALPVVLRRMMALGKDFVMTPYPKRDAIDWERIMKRRPDQHPETVAYNYPLRSLPDRFFIEADGTAEIMGGGMGCTLLSRACLESMVEHYGRNDVVDVDAIRAPSFTAELSREQLVALVGELADKLELWQSGNAGLVYTDQFPGRGPVEMVALFQLLNRDRALFSEDISFCQRWRDMGGQVWGYYGPGSPVVHHGHHAYGMRVKGFDLNEART